MVGEHSVRAEGPLARGTRVYRRENVGMSNHNPNEKLGPRKSKVSVALAINHGLGGPKAMEKSAADGQQVNIPARRMMCDGVTARCTPSALLVWRFEREDRCLANPAPISLMRTIQALRRGAVLPYRVGRARVRENLLSLVIWLRTGNRHWWIGRVAQGERVIRR